VGDIAFLSAKQLAGRIRRGRLGALEALEYYIERVERLDGAVNSVVVRDFERARERARMLDRKRKPVGRLHGVPMTVKESFDVAGLPTTWGAPECRDNIASANALAIERLEGAGAVVFGKTNVPLMLDEWQSFNEIYGATSNPWDLERTPGGSSGGAAAALAAGLTGLELGTDIGGSVRVPAHMCGVYAHKPTWGLCPPRGHSLKRTIAPVDIAVIGPLARSADDLALAMEAIAGPDPSDTRLEFVLPPPRTSKLRAMRVAVWACDDATATDPEITAKLLELAQALEHAGAKVDRLARPAFEAKAAYELYVRLLAAAVGSRLSADAIDAARERSAARAQGDPSTAALMDRNYDLPYRTWATLNEERHVLRRTWQAFFEDWDVLLCPAFGTPALPQDTVTSTADRRVCVDGREIAYDDLLFWPGITGGFHVPATVAPLGFTAGGLPLGVQIVGPLFGDRATIAFARLLESVWLAFTPPPLP
jgi:amidase